MTEPSTPRTPPAAAGRAAARRPAGALPAAVLLLSLALVVTAVAATSARRELHEARERAAMLRQWVEADEAFIDGDRERARELYATLVKATGDSSLLQRAVHSASEPESGNARAARRASPAGASQRTAQAELTRVSDQSGELASANDGDAALADSLAMARAEITSLRSALAERPLRGVLQFRSAKEADEVWYVGDVRDGRAHGRGVGIWNTGSRYDGEWRANRRHGIGTFTWKDGETYDGEFADDRRTGRGVYVWRTGERWEGDWLDDMRHGDGVLFDAKGKVRTRGRWERDRLVTSSPP